MQKHGFDGGRPKIAQRLADAEFEVGGLVVPRVRAVDLGVDGEPGGGAGPAEARFGGALDAWGVVARRVQVAVSAAVERVQEGLDVLIAVEVRGSGVDDRIANLLRMVSNIQLVVLRYAYTMGSEDDLEGGLASHYERGDVERRKKEGVARVEVMRKD